MQTLTNDLCYNSQIIRNPKCVPAPIAMDCAERGGVIMFVNNGETGNVDYRRTNKKYTYLNKNLGKIHYHFFITKQHQDAQKYIKAAEQRWDVLTQHIHSETVMNIIDKRHKTTLLGIIQKINMKLGGLNYRINSTSVDEKAIVLGFATSHKPSGYDDTKLVAVGFASNCLDDTHKFLGGYKYVENGKDVYGKHLAEILETALKAKKRQTELKPEKVIINFHGVNEAVFPIVRNSYVEICEKVFTKRGPTQ
ncbi:unnamed protein product [Caenorhabditis brenneri]